MIESPEPGSRKNSFPPVVDAGVRVLVLGSLPGEKSLAEARYYANPRNQFWALMEAVTARPLVRLGYGERLESLLAARVGLWDTVRSATRRGSLDSAIRDLAANDLPALIARLPELRAIGFNGATSAAIGRKDLSASDLALIDLPSSSPAYTLSFEHKREAWLRLRDYL